MLADALYKFDVYEFDPIHGCLWFDKRILKLSPTPCELLRVFVTHPKKVLSVEFLINHAWDEDRDPKDGAVSYQIFFLRRILGDDSRKPRFIETVQKRGFCFLPKVTRRFAKTEAGELYEKARHLYQKSTPQDLNHAISYYKRVIEINREYVAEAYAGISEAFVLLGSFGHQIMPATLGMENAREAALKALSLDDRSSEAHAALASVAALYDWNWKIAAEHFEKAIQLTTNPLAKPLVRAWYALCLAARGDAIGARREIEIAKSDFPSSFVLLALSGRIAYLAGDARKAIAECDESITLERHFFLSHVFRGHSLVLLKDYPAAEATCQIACDLSGNHPVCVAEMGHVRALQGRNNAAQEIISQLEETAQRRYVSPHLFAYIYLGMGKINEVFRWLDKTYAQREAYLIFLTTDPVYDQIRSDSRFAELVKRVAFA